ncbi:MAG: hypothetical protein QOJ29_2528 [Thermoleophilaceae bacterium]|nr:hypothetical protein [Thermoleophilaceae bacterium]
MKLHLKFEPGSDAGGRRAVAQRARLLGAKRVRPMVPGATKPAFRSMYVVELDDDADSSQVIDALNAEECVQSVEREFTRGLAAADDA